MTDLIYETSSEEELYENGWKITLIPDPEGISLKEILALLMELQEDLL